MFILRFCLFFLCTYFAQKSSLDKQCSMEGSDLFFFLIDVTVALYLSSGIMCDFVAVDTKLF